MTLTPEEQAKMLADADAAYEASMRPDDGMPVDASSISMPNFAKSKVLNVRINEGDHAALTAIAAERGVAISDVVRAAIRRYVRDDSSAVSDLVTALRDAGLELKHIQAR